MGNTDDGPALQALGLVLAPASSPHASKYHCGATGPVAPTARYRPAPEQVNIYPIRERWRRVLWPHVPAVEDTLCRAIATIRSDYDPAIHIPREAGFDLDEPWPRTRECAAAFRMYGNCHVQAAIMLALAKRTFPDASWSLANGRRHSLVISSEGMVLDLTAAWLHPGRAPMRFVYERCLDDPGVQYWDDVDEYIDERLVGNCPFGAPREMRDNTYESLHRSRDRIRPNSQRGGQALPTARFRPAPDEVGVYPIRKQWDHVFRPHLAAIQNTVVRAIAAIRSNYDPAVHMPREAGQEDGDPWPKTRDSAAAYRIYSACPVQAVIMLALAKRALPDATWNLAHGRQHCLVISECGIVLDMTQAFLPEAYADEIIALCLGDTAVEYWDDVDEYIEQRLVGRFGVPAPMPVHTRGKRR